MYIDLGIDRGFESPSQEAKGQTTERFENEGDLGPIFRQAEDPNEKGVGGEARFARLHGGSLRNCA